jgi:hypothetical protein
LAIKNGCIELFKLIIELDHPFEINMKFATSIVLKAVIRGDLQIIKFLESIGYTLGQDELVTAASLGHLHYLEYWSKTNDVCQDKADAIIYQASMCGYLDIVKFAFDKSSLGGHRKALTLACFSSHIDIIEYILDNDKSLIKTVEIETAYRPGVLEILCCAQRQNQNKFAILQKDISI